MDMFIFTTIITFLFSCLAITHLNNKKEANIIFTAVVMVVLVLVSGLRNGIGDTVYYIHSYNMIGPEYNFMDGGYEPAFCLLLKILHSISPNPQLMIMVTSIIINVLNVWIIRKYSKDWFELSVFLYVTTYYMVTMNGLRQSLAAALIFSATPLLIKKKTILYCSLMVFLLLFHESTFIMIPLYFVVTKKAWSKEIWITIGIFIITMFFYEPVMKIIFSVMGDSKYAGYADSNEGGANVLRIIIYFIPVLLSYLGRENLYKWKYSDVFINMTLINFIIMAFSYFNWIFARFTIYTQLYVVVSLPFLIKKCFSSKERRILYWGVMVFYFLFFILEIKVGYINYYSDYSLKDLLFY